MTDRYDAIVVGAGHNGLVCSALLAKAGKKVLVLEANERVGGAAVTREFADGFSVSACAHLLYQLQPKVRKTPTSDRTGRFTGR
jgi:phytoene dehydrogenase-like protein